MIQKYKFVMFASILAVFLLFITSNPVTYAATAVFINEIHYDNAGGDTGEAVEIAGPAGTDLSSWTLVLYNGSNGTAYATLGLSTTLADQSDGYGFEVVNLPTNGIQNGGPDGMALIDDLGTVVQFLSYEGSFTATDGLSRWRNKCRYRCI